MKLKEAIQHCDDVIHHCNNKECQLDHKQLKDWLIELKQLRNERRIKKNK